MRMSHKGIGLVYIDTAQMCRVFICCWYHTADHDSNYTSRTCDELVADHRAYTAYAHLRECVWKSLLTHYFYTFGARMTAAIPAICEQYPGDVCLNISLKPPFWHIDAPPCISTCIRTHTSSSDELAVKMGFTHRDRASARYLSCWASIRVRG